MKERNCFLFIKKSYGEKGNDRFWPQRRPTLLIKINRQGSFVCRRTVGAPPHPALTHLQQEQTAPTTDSFSPQDPCHSAPTSFRATFSLASLSFLVKLQQEEFNVSWGDLYPKATRVTALMPPPLHPSVATSRGTFCLVPPSPNRVEPNCLRLHPTD